MFLGMKGTMILWNFENHLTRCNIQQDFGLCVFHIQNTNNAEENTSTTEINHFNEIPKLLHLFLIISHHTTNIMKYETVLKNSLFL